VPFVFAQETAVRLLREGENAMLGSKKHFMDRIKVWPHMTIMAVVLALAAGLGVAFG
jgi:hypothetical protein